MTTEPRLEDIGDYNKLQGEKRVVVWGVIITGIIIGTLYLYISKNFGNVSDEIITTDSIKNIPLKK